MMDQFPVELKLELFFALPDIPSLVALTQTSSSLRRIFTNSQSRIVATVLSNEIHPVVFPHAIAAWEASRIKPWSMSGVKSFLERYPESYLQQPRSIQTLSEASTISKLHDHVQFFTEDFCASVLSVHPITKVPENTYIPPSTKELCRIQTAFYRFELSCVFVRSERFVEELEDRYSVTEQHELLLKKFKLWENEQLASVYDYLMRELSVAFEDMVEHDVCWGESMIDDGPDLPPPLGRVGYLSQGLEFLRQLSMAETYQDRNAVFDRGIPSDYYVLAAAFEAQGSDNELENPGPEQSAMELQSLAVSELSMENDSGPVEAWYWAHETHASYYYDSCGNLREWGYCLWDKARLQTWGLFRKPWTPDREMKRAARLKEEKQRRDKRLRKSWKERSRIFRLGGRGWWAKGDESKIVWSHGTPA